MAELHHVHRVYLLGRAHPFARKPRSPTPALVYVNKTGRLPIVGDVGEIVMQRVAVLRKLPDPLNLDVTIFLAPAGPLIRSHWRHGKRRPEIRRLLGPIGNNGLRWPPPKSKKYLFPP